MKTKNANPFTYEQLTEDDPYKYLEEVESDVSLTFAKNNNDACLEALGDPKTSGTKTYERVLSILESNDRIPYASKYGNSEEEETILFNFWKDSNNPKGIWRRTTMDSYKTEKPKWTTVLDIDELGKKESVSWVYKGNSALPKARDDPNILGEKYGQCVTRVLVKLSRGGADAVEIREFDLISEKFVSQEEDNGFFLPEAKSRVSYKNRHVLYVGTDFGEGSLTDSGYPRVIKNWVRGTSLEDASILFEGEKTDVSVFAYLSDQRLNGGPVYEVAGRSVTFYTSKYFVRILSEEQLLASEPQDCSSPGDFKQVDIQDDAEIMFLGKWMMISLRSDWEPVPGGKTYKSGSFIYTDAINFLDKSKEESSFEVLFEPTETTSFNGYTCTKNYLIMFTMDNVKDKMDFYKIEEDGSLKFITGDKEGKIRSCSATPIDPYENNMFWFTTSGYTQPSTLYLADAEKIAEATESNEEDKFIVEKLKSLPDMYDAQNLNVKQEFAISEDGTKVPYFIVSRNDVTLDGTNQVLLYGYGGFEISMGPKYIGSVGAAWLERGGIYVEACIRGGGEYGPNWHQEALKANRNKSYEDFIAIAEDLISSKVCKSSTLAIRGGR